MNYTFDNDDYDLNIIKRNDDDLLNYIGVNNDDDFA